MFFADVNKWEREIAPSHYMLRIDSFSKLTTMLSKSHLHYFKSKSFDASGYKWNFLVYPNGDVKTNSIGHISMSVCIEDAAALPKDWAKYADLKFFIYDQVRQKYSVFQVGGASSLHDFHSLKTEGGITKLVSRAVFDDAANGYLVNDKCVFGVEVFLLDSKFAEERLNMCVEVDKTFTWTISNYSKLGSEVHNSYEFPAASFKWFIACFYLVF
nr:MATH domain and coiled-coil domain-containing protein At3g58400-like [Ipomoea batatas]